MFNPIDFAMNMIRNNPKIANNPQAQSFIDVIQRGDAKQGEEIANNLLQTYGLSKEEALQQIKNSGMFPM